MNPDRPSRLGASITPPTVAVGFMPEPSTDQASSDVRVPTSRPGTSKVRFILTDPRGPELRRLESEAVTVR